jgi:hypothetical protein
MGTISRGRTNVNGLKRGEKPGHTTNFQQPQILRLARGPFRRVLAQDDKLRRRPYIPGIFIPAMRRTKLGLPMPLNILRI